MAVPLSAIKGFIVAEKSAGRVLASSSAFMVVEGFEGLSFFVATHSLPMLKNGVIEYSTPMGIKTSVVSRTQPYNSITMSFNERESLIVKSDIERIIMSGKNGDLKISFFIGDGDRVNSKLWGTMILGKFIVEDNPEVDAEGSETALKISCTLSGHYFPEACTEDLATRGIAKASMDKLTTHSPSEC